MATYRNSYSESDLETDSFGSFVRVQHNLGKLAPLHVAASQAVAGRSIPYEIDKLFYISNNRLHVYTGALGAEFSLSVRVSD